MVPGLNTRITRSGSQYHVQTEDLGDKEPCILTLVYLGGAIVLRRKIDYREVLGAQASSDQVRAFMEEQHQRTSQQFADGRFEICPDPPPAPSGPAGPPGQPKSVDELIAEYLHRRRRRAAG